MIVSSNKYIDFTIPDDLFDSSRKILAQSKSFTACKVSVFGVFVVFIFRHSDYIRRDTDTDEYGHFSCSDSLLAYFHTVSHICFKYF